MASLGKSEIQSLPHNDLVDFVRVDPGIVVLLLKHGLIY